MGRDPYPLPCTQDREKYHGDRHYDFWLSGLKDYLLITQRLREHGVEVNASGGPPKGWRVLDFGCASGRVLRHFVCQGDDLDVWGCDIALSHVQWIDRHLGPRPRVFHNHALPHLPLEDNSFDLVYAFSVFSHIDDFEGAWLLELRRILRPGGFAYLTTHTDHTWKILKPEHGIYNNMLTRPFTATPEVKIGPEMFQAPLPHERVVFAVKGATVYGKNVFHSTDYLRRVWGRFFEIREIYREGAYYQDVVLLRKPE